MLPGALYDPLTGAANRVLVNDRIEHAMARVARRTGSSVALLFVDLDRFKPINDRHGHACGDLVLQVVARRLVDCTRGEEFVGRLGGDEFCVVVEVHSAHDAEVLAATLAAAIEQPIRCWSTAKPKRCRSERAWASHWSPVRRHPKTSSAAPTQRCTTPSAAAGTVSPPEGSARRRDLEAINGPACVNHDVRQSHRKGRT